MIFRKASDPFQKINVAIDAHTTNFFTSSFRLAALTHFLPNNINYIKSSGARLKFFEWQRRQQRQQPRQKTQKSVNSRTHRSTVSHAGTTHCHTESRNGISLSITSDLFAKRTRNNANRNFCAKMKSYASTKTTETAWCNFDLLQRRSKKVLHDSFSPGISSRL